MSETENTFSYYNSEHHHYRTNDSEEPITLLFDICEASIRAGHATIECRIVNSDDPNLTPRRSREGRLEIYTALNHVYQTKEVKELQATHNASSNLSPESRIRTYRMIGQFAVTEHNESVGARNCGNILEFVSP
uniref:Uncharacterized protein n=1 Tax=Kwoniella bestiolae CBS 10118 TaxID=1296100 RepID=A0A1B9GAA5_9TREE|nr:hypothetical protein I302_02805 [Kwoniella bestiolae CBS 10118]OCF27955.1 hypothetical protein I302_02805 [Kwoniella bestiolae CBS 10118]